MEKIRVSSKFSFDLAHALYQYDGACRFIHGHTYYLKITLLGTIINEINHPKNGMVLDFKVLKKIVKEKVIAKYDHALILSHQSYAELKSESLKKNHKLIITDFQPTCENLLVEIKNEIATELPEFVQLFAITLNETENSYAEWFLSDQTNSFFH